MNEHAPHLRQDPVEWLRALQGEGEREHVDEEHVDEPPPAGPLEPWGLRAARSQRERRAEWRRTIEPAAPVEEDEISEGAALLELWALGACREHRARQAARDGRPAVLGVAALLILCVVARAAFGPGALLLLFAVAALAALCSRPRNGPQPF